METIQIILNTESTLCLLFLCSSLLFATCLYVLKLYKFKILNTENFYCNYFKMYLCKDFKILKSEN